MSETRWAKAVALALVLAAAAGCFRKYRDSQEWARETFSDDTGCQLEKVTAHENGTLWQVDGCGKSSLCDIVDGDWSCKPMTAGAAAGVPGAAGEATAEAPYARAWRAVLALSTCPRERVVPRSQKVIAPGVTDVQIDSCGTLYACRVLDTGAPGCAALGPAGPTPAAVQAPPPGGYEVPPPPPFPDARPSTPAAAPAAECVPRCRSGYTCQAGTCVGQCNPPCGPGTLCLNDACVSACNPPCPRGQRCTADGECAAN